MSSGPVSIRFELDEQTGELIVDVVGEPVRFVRRDGEWSIESD
jgi:hypothetical protein